MWHSRRTPKMSFTMVAFSSSVHKTRVLGLLSASAACPWGGLTRLAPFSNNHHVGFSRSDGGGISRDTSANNQHFTFWVSTILSSGDWIGRNLPAVSPTYFALRRVPSSVFAEGWCNRQARSRPRLHRQGRLRSEIGAWKRLFSPHDSIYYYPLVFSVEQRRCNTPGADSQVLPCRECNTGYYSKGISYL